MINDRTPFQGLDDLRQRGLAAAYCTRASEMTGAAARTLPAGPGAAGQIVLPLAAMVFQFCLTASIVSKSPTPLLTPPPPVHCHISVNNAGYGQFGMVEEISEAEIRAQLETNVLGALWITQAALPYLREQRSGHIVQVSSIGGIAAFPNTGAYHASKWALEGLSQSLAAEVARFGISVTLIEPTGCFTDWAGSSAKHASPLAAYEPVREQAALAHAGRFTPGDPGVTREAVLKLVDTPNPPLRLFVDELLLGLATADYKSRLAPWRAWQPVTAARALFRVRGKAVGRHSCS